MYYVTTTEWARKPYIGIEYLYTFKRQKRQQDLWGRILSLPVSSVDSTSGWRERMTRYEPQKSQLQQWYGADKNVDIIYYDIENNATCATVIYYLRTGPSFCNKKVFDRIFNLKLSHNKRIKFHAKKISYGKNIFYSRHFFAQ